MDNLPRQKLCEMIATYGRSLVDDPRRCEALLRDLCWEHRREVNVLVSALKARVVADLLASSTNMPRDVLLGRLTKRLHDDLAMSEDAARWAVESWAQALGTVSIHQDIAALIAQARAASHADAVRILTEARLKVEQLLAKMPGDKVAEQQARKIQEQLRTLALGRATELAQRIPTQSGDAAIASLKELRGLLRRLLTETPSDAAIQEQLRQVQDQLRSVFLRRAETQRPADAMATYREALSVLPGDSVAQSHLSSLEQQLTTLKTNVRQLLHAGLFAKAVQESDAAIREFGQEKELLEFRQKAEKLQAKLEALAERISTLRAYRRYVSMLRELDELVALCPNVEGVQEARDEAEQAIAQAEQLTAHAEELLPDSKPHALLPLYVRIKQLLVPQKRREALALYQQAVQQCADFKPALVGTVLVQLFLRKLRRIQLAVAGVSLAVITTTVLVVTSIARKKAADESAWKVAVATEQVAGENFEPAIGAYQSYLAKFSTGLHASEAKQMLEVTLPLKMDEQLWTHAIETVKVAGDNYEQASREYQNYLAKFPTGSHTSEAGQKVEDFVKELLRKGKEAQDVGNWDTAIASFRKAAEAGSPTAMSNFGVMYQNGLGVQRDYTEALKWYRRAVAAGDVRGMAYLGSMYGNGFGVQRDYTEALKWYRRAVAAGDVRGMAYLGSMYGNGFGVQRDYTEALKWWRKAADAGDPRGMSSLGAMYAYGWGLPRDYTEAYNWCVKAAQTGDADGMSALGVLYANGWGVAKDYKEAMNWFRKATEAGSLGGMVCLGVGYQNGWAVAQDYNEALKCYRTASEAGATFGMAKLGIMYEQGRGVPRNYLEALKWFRKAAEAGDANGMASLGRMYCLGYGVPQNYAEALKWFRKMPEATDYLDDPELKIICEEAIKLIEELPKQQRQ